MMKLTILQKNMSKKKMKVLCALIMGATLMIVSSPSYSMHCLESVVIQASTARMRPIVGNYGVRPYIHRSFIHTSSALLHEKKGFWIAPSSPHRLVREVKPQPWDYVLLPRVSNLAEFLYKNKIVDRSEVDFTEEEKNRLKDILSGITLYKRFDPNDEDADWVAPRTLGALKENYTFFLAELITALEEAIFPVYSNDYLKNYKPIYTDEELPTLIEYVMFLMNQHHQKMSKVNQWQLDSKQVYHQFHELLKNYKKLQDGAEKCSSYSEFMRVYNEVLLLECGKPKNRTRLKTHSMFFGPNDTKSFLEQMKAFHRGAGDSYY